MARSWSACAAVLLTLVGAWCLSAAPAIACTASPEAFERSNFDQIKAADAVVVATPTGHEGRGYGSGVVNFRIERVLKSVDPHLEGTTVSSAGDLLGRVRKPADPPAYESLGICGWRTFLNGATYVLFLEKDHQQSGWRVVGFPYGDQLFWSDIVQTYIRIEAENEPMAELEALEKLRRQARSRPVGGKNTAIVGDLDSHFAHTSPWKPTAYLIAAYEAADPAPPLPVSPRDPKDQALLALVVGEHPDAAPLFDRIIASDQLTPWQLGLALRFYAKNGQYRRAYRLIETLTSQTLVGASPQDTSDLLSAINIVQEGEPPKDGEPRWQTDPHVAASWPELAFRLDRHAKRVIGERGTFFGDALRSITVANYRERPDLTRALAQTHDPKLEAWAIGQVADEPALRAWQATEETRGYGVEDPAQLPLEALVLGFGDKRDAALRLAACQGPERHNLLIRALGDWGDGLDENVVEMVAGLPDLPADDKDELARAMARIYAREMGSLEFERLKDFLAGEKKVPATRC